MIKQPNLDKFVWAIFPCILLVNFILLINTKFTLWPEIMVYPYLLNNGFTLYRDLINPYPPAVTYLFAFLFKQFDYSVNSFQLFTWLIVVLINSAVYLVSLKSFGNKKGAVLSMAFFAFFSILFGVNGLWFDLIQTPLIILSVYFFAKFVKERNQSNLDNAFLFAMLTVFVKQQAFWLVIFYVLAVSYFYQKQAKHILVRIPKTILLGAVIAIAHTLIFYKLDTLSDFVRWVIFFPIRASSQEGYFSPPTAKQFLVVLCTLLVFVPTIFNGKKLEKTILLCALTLLLFAYPRFDYFHLIPSLSILAIIFGKNLTFFKKANWNIKATSVIGLAFIFLATVRFVGLNWQKEVRFFESDIIASATLLAISVPHGEKIYIQNGPDQLLPLSRALPPKPWADEFPWYLENNNMQERVIYGLKDDKPTFIVYKPYDIEEKYALGSYQPEKISNYLNKNYSSYFQMSDTLWLKKRNNDL